MIDVENLLSPLGEDTPCGEDLEYDPEFIELERLSQFKEEQQFGDTVVEAEEPDWKQVAKQALLVLERSRDLRAALRLVPAAVRLEGYAGLRDAMAVLEGFVTTHWEHVHPQLDPDDDNDPTFRVNTVNGLNDFPSVLKGIQLAPLVFSKMLGNFSLRDVLLATGELQVRPGEEGSPPDPAHIDGAFSEAEGEQLDLTAAAIDASLRSAHNLETAFTEAVGVAASPNLAALIGILDQARKVVTAHIARRGGGVGEGEPTDEPGAEGAGARSGSSASLSGEINSRDDVIRAIDKICRYYERAEPGSPIPILLRRARRLVTKDFMALIEDLAPGGLTEIQSIRGKEDSPQAHDGWGSTEEAAPSSDANDGW